MSSSPSELYSSSEGKSSLSGAVARSIVGEVGEVEEGRWLLTLMG